MIHVIGLMLWLVASVDDIQALHLSHTDCVIMASWPNQFMQTFVPSMHHKDLLVYTLPHICAIWQQWNLTSNSLSHPWVLNFVDNSSSHFWYEHDWVYFYCAESNGSNKVNDAVFKALNRGGIQLVNELIQRQELRWSWDLPAQYCFWGCIWSIDLHSEFHHCNIAKENVPMGNRMMTADIYHTVSHAMWLHEFPIW